VAAFKQKSNPIAKIGLSFVIHPIAYSASSRFNGNCVPEKAHQAIVRSSVNFLEMED
jgi:hypothetical protein